MEAPSARNDADRTAALEAAVRKLNRQRKRWNIVAVLVVVFIVLRNAALVVVYRNRFEADHVDFKGVSADLVRAGRILLEGPDGAREIEIGHGPDDGKPQLTFFDPAGKIRLQMRVDAEAASLALSDGNEIARAGMAVRDTETDGHVARVFLGSSGGTTVMNLGVSKDDDPSIRFKDSTGEPGAVLGLENGRSRLLVKNPHGSQSLALEASPFDDFPSTIVVARDGKRRVYVYDQRPRGPGDERGAAGAARR